MKCIWIEVKCNNNDNVFVFNNTRVLVASWLVMTKCMLTTYTIPNPNNYTKRPASGPFVQSRFRLSTLGLYVFFLQMVWHSVVLDHGVQYFQDILDNFPNLNSDFKVRRIHWYVAETCSYASRRIVFVLQCRNPIARTQKTSSVKYKSFRPRQWA